MVSSVGHRSARSALAPVVLGSLVVVSGCGDQAQPPVPPSTFFAPAPVSSAPDERAAVENAYTQYWPRSAQAPHQPEATWHDAMAAIATDPQLSTTLAAMRRNKNVGLTTYGDVMVRISSVEVAGSTATVVDCQDASRAGQEDARTGDRKTVGVPRMPVRATLVRDPADGRWKVSQLAFPDGGC